MKEAPKPPRTFLEFVFDRTNALRQSHAESLFQSQFNAARVQPPEHLHDRVSRQRRGQALAGCGRRPIPAPPGFSRRTPVWQGQPATPGASPNRVRETPHPSAARLQPLDTCLAESVNAASGLMPGVPGAVAPGKIILESPPSPPGKGAGGIGGKKANQRQGRQATKKASHPCEHHSGSVNRQRRG